MPFANDSANHRTMARAVPDYVLENGFIEAGARYVAGVDEVGRGPLAGPVVVAAVILDAGAIPDGIADSKLLSAPQRETLFAALFASAIVSVAAASPAEIDRLNIRGATLAAMSRAVAALSRTPCRVLVDGRDRPACACPAEAIVGGDAKCVSIAAASIVAKVARDRLMDRLARAHPGYGFETNRGYGTPAHLAALGRLGPTPIHRRSFAPVAQLAMSLPD